MRVFLLLLTALLPISFPSFASEDILASSTISAVTVFADRATVTRIASVELSPGASAVVIDALPEHLFSDSLRAEGRSSGGEVVLGAVESKLISSAELVVARERELTAKLEDMNDQRALILADQQALSQKKQFLESLGQQAALRSRENIAALDLKPQQWREAAGMMGAETADILRQIAAKDVDLRRMDRQIAALQSDLRDVQTGARNKYQVRVPVEAKGAAKLTLTLSYQLGNASWTPLYDARLATATGKVNFVQFGQVRQKTGEDWAGVKITLSTAQPTRGAALPPLDPMWVMFTSPQFYGRGKNALLSVRDGGMDKMSRTVIASAQTAEPEHLQENKPLELEQDASFLAATAVTGGFVTEYVIPGATDVPADNSVRKVMIGARDVDSTLMVKIKPQIASSAFLVAVTKITGEAPLLPGTANLFRDGVFVGSLSLPLLRPGETADLGFGVDDQVVVKQRVMKDEQGESGVVVSNATRTRHTITEVQNLHKKPISIAVLQTVPVPRDEKIKLALLPELTRAGYVEKVDNIAGQMRWTLDLKPSEKAEIGLGWMLSWPSDAFLSGLPF